MRSSVVSDEDGNIAALFAVLLFPILIAVAFTIDTIRQVSTSKHLQFAVDVAAMTGAQAIQDGDLTDRQIKARMAASFEANADFSNWGVTCDPAKIGLDENDEYAVKFETTCRFPRLLGKTLSKQDQLIMKRSARSTKSLPSLDIALMLDNSQSMAASGRMAALQAAAKDLVASLITDESDARVRIALVPYGEAVNAGVYGNRAQGKEDDDDSDGDGSKVCVTHRENLESQYTDAPPVEGHYVGDWAGSICRSPMVVPLTHDLDALNTGIDNLSADDYSTAGHLGLAWSWYAISSNWNDIWPEASRGHPNDEPNALKVVVMMSDGTFNRHHDYGSRRAYSQSAIDTMALCENMRADGVVIYAVGLDIEAPHFHWVTESWLESYGPDTVFRSCAGDSSRYYQPSNGSELDQMYAEISEKLEVESVKVTQ